MPAVKQGQNRTVVANLECLPHILMFIKEVYPVLTHKVYYRNPVTLK